MNLLTGQADVGGCSSVPDRNGGVAAALAAHDIATRLRSIVFVSKPVLRLRLDIKRVSLRARGSGISSAAALAVQSVEATSELLDDLAQIVHVLLDDPPRLLQARGLGTRRQLNGFVGLVHDTDARGESEREH
ncbi:hypothetical protein [Bradyrhizobium sp. SSUT77]|uniref:hypothetical protein n=1 Tax=Bradyrhizobium sp. SSUT77 TaxID=3040603 RepID=UPI002448B4E1|nr:hypothetical protein [Bradyrhizobium sp. SSUT77]MDH2341497.1 hypothetical protein [Bradyrhizobium sp. SSUT77]